MRESHLYRQAPMLLRWKTHILASISPLYSVDSAGLSTTHDETSAHFSTYIWENWTRAAGVSKCKSTKGSWGCLVSRTGSSQQEGATTSGPELDAHHGRQLPLRIAHLPRPQSKRRMS